MVISGMNRYFARHGRVTLGVLAIVISVSFVLYLSNFSVASLFTYRYRDDIGTVGGKAVSRADYIAQIDRTILSLCLDSPLYTPKSISRDRVAPAAVHRLVQLQAARERGIDVGQEDVAAYLREAPVLQRDGAFQLATYESYVKDQLEANGFTRQDLDEAVRESLIIERLQRSVMDAVIVTPREVREAFVSHNEKFAVRALRFDPTAEDEAIAADEEQLAGFFGTRRDSYAMPPRCRVEVVRFNYTEFQEAAAARITEEAIAAHYAANAKEFTEGEGDEAKAKPLAEVAEAIRGTLADAAAREMARTAAERFADDAFNHVEDAVERARSGDAAAIRRDAFRAFVADRGLRHEETAWLDADVADLPRIGREPDLVRAALELYPDQPVSDAISGSRAAFVAFLLEREEERPAELAEVRARVLADFREEEARKRARERARNACLRLSEALALGTAFPEAAASVGIVPEEIDEFPASQPPMVKDGYLVGELAAATPAGQVSEVRETYRGALAVWVERRTPPSNEEFAKEEDAFTNRYRSWKAGNAWQSFTFWLESQAKFVFQP